MWNRHGTHSFGSGSQLEFRQNATFNQGLWALFFKWQTSIFENIPSCILLSYVILVMSVHFVTITSTFVAKIPYAFCHPWVSRYRLCCTSNINPVYKCYSSVQIIELYLFINYNWNVIAVCICSLLYIFNTISTSIFPSKTHQKILFWIYSYTLLSCVVTISWCWTQLIKYINTESI